MLQLLSNIRGNATAVVKSNKCLYPPPCYPLSPLLGDTKACWSLC